MVIWYIYIISIVYCLYQMRKGYNRSSTDGVIGPTPGLETIVLLLLAPVWAIVDIFFTGLRKYNERKES